MPATPRSNQNRRIASCSARTSGWSQLRSGWLAANRWRYHSPGVPSAFVVRVQVVPAKLLGQSVGISPPSGPLSGPEPETVPLRRSRAGRERGLEPGVLVGDVVGHDVHDRPDAHRPRLRDQRLGLLERAERRIDRAVVGDVIAAVGERRPYQA